MDKLIIKRARDYGIECHKSVNHTYDGKPYEVHLQLVYEYAVKFSFLLPYEAKEQVLAAAWLHDTIEDCRQTYNDIKKEMGISIADIVFALTNEKGKTRKDRANDKYYSEMKKIPFADYLKICDRLANVKYSRQSGSKMINVYRKENEEFKKHLWCLAYESMFYELSDLLIPTMA